MGVNVANGKLWGIVRTTLSTVENRATVRQHVSMADAEDDVYATNIQIAELNMLNAAMAVIRWKRHCGIYQDDNREFHSTYSTNTHLLTE
jgi:hypothetical protein